MDAGVCVIGSGVYVGWMLVCVCDGEWGICGMDAGVCVMGSGVYVGWMLVLSLIHI